jgi:hypothetical protein
MNVFSTTPATPLRAAPDPFKHVKYTYGMVLGAEDFAQEFSYLAAHDHWITRDLIGYGTVSGLKVTYEQNGGRPRLLVAPGVAVTPRGEMVRVPRAQCAFLNDWLKSEAAAARADAARTSPTDSRIDVYIALCYRECETDDLPIPGEPCRDEADLMAPSRVADDFKLDLRLDPPEQPDERAVRDFVQWLSAIPIVDGPSSVTLPEFLDAIRYGAALVGSPPSLPPDFMFGSPPASVQVGRADVCRYLRAAYRLWTVELRGRWYASWWNSNGCCSGSTKPAESPESCVLLSRVSLPLVLSSVTGSPVWQVASAIDPTVDDEERPFLVPLRMLQESLWCGCAGGSAAGGSIVAAGSLGVTVGPTVPSGPFGLIAFRPTTVPAGPPAWTAGDFWLQFNGYEGPGRARSFDYVINVTPVLGDLANPRVDVAAFDAEGIRLRLKENTRPVSPAGLELMVEVKKYAR